VRRHRWCTERGRRGPQRSGAESEAARKGEAPIASEDTRRGRAGNDKTASSGMPGAATFFRGEDMHSEMRTASCYDFAPAMVFSRLARHRDSRAGCSAA